MIVPYYADDSVTLYHGDALESLRGMVDGSADCIVTSPPYYGLRDYGEPGQYGLESSPVAYVETMRSVFAEARRVLAADGTLWLNLGDSYAYPPGSAGRQGAGQRAGRTFTAEGLRGTTALPPKNLLGIPWRVAFALQDDGWILRNEIIWSKPNAMPESVGDRLSTRHETVFLFARSPRYWFDLNAVREPHSTAGIARAGRQRLTVDRSQVGVGSPNTMEPQQSCHPQGRNPGDVWSIPTQPFAAAHFAVMPPVLAERCILAGCRPDGVVLDPFAGSGTTGMVATRHGRRFVGVDLSAAYLDLALRTRLAQDCLPLAGAS